MRCMNNIKFSCSKVKNTNYWFLLIFEKFITLFKRFCQSRSRAYFKVFSIQNQTKFCWAKNILPHYFFFAKGILRSRQSETFKKGHTKNTGVFYKKSQLFPNECSIQRVSRFWVKKWINLDFNQKLQKISIFNVVKLFYLCKYRPKILGACFFHKKLKVNVIWENLKFWVADFTCNIPHIYIYSIFFKWPWRSWLRSWQRSWSRSWQRPWSRS